MNIKVVLRSKSPRILIFNKNKIKSYLMASVDLKPATVFKPKKKFVVYSFPSNNSYFYKL